MSLDGKRRIIIFSGAGLSAESGLQTYRDHDGLWEKHRIEDVATADAFAAHPHRVHRFMSDRRQELARVAPNAAHHGMATLQQLYSVVNITQNIDDLLERAGCTEIIHLHGFLPEIRCLACDHVWDIGHTNYDGHPCPRCAGQRTKPNIVLFGDPAPLYQVLHHLFFPAYKEDALTQKDIVVVIGTMGNVVPISHYLWEQKCTKILNNLEDSPFVPASMFDYVFLKPATAAISEIIDVISGL
ncbi:NAD-dependent protein deacetylase of SIR2 family [invertebrate metagenome]|uniref:NAD-dependent protein deacetylase of SIR2 family n=1 Tax=invertebrate metagenome TaxID=1711999 RepID=A0A484H4C7_9ZZZZ